jgi:UDP-N-acetylmuramyl tripeptide synthase
MLMKITSLKVYEGQNIKREKRIIRVTLQVAARSEVVKCLKAYFRVCFLLGYKEKLIDIESDGEVFVIWVTYTSEEVSKYVLYNSIYHLENVDKLAEKGENLVKNGIIYDLIQTAKVKGIPVIEISEDLFQLGYGKNSVYVGTHYQSYENMVKVELSRNRKNLWQNLKYTHLPKVDGKVLYSIEEIKEIANYRYPINLRSIDKTTDIKITISDEEELNRVLNNMMNMYTRAFVYSGRVKYRVICYKGQVGILLKKEEGYKIIELSDKKLELLEIAEVLEKLKEFCNRVYKAIPIEFMYVDLQEEEEIKVVDLGCVFDVGEELKDVRNKVIEYLLNCLIEERVGLIPIIAVTGTNGKTTTARLIYYLLEKLNINSALTSTGGIFIGNKKIKSGDTTGFLSARDVLTNRKVEAAVMETARGGILKNGLGYEKARAVVFTSISEDHIGMSGIKDLKDLINIKAVLLHELDTKGKIIIKAQKELVELSENRSNVVLYNIEKNSFIEEHIESNKEALYLDESFIVHCVNKEVKKLLDVREIPFTHYGNSKSNIMNVMAAIAAALTVESDIAEILKSLKDLKCDLYFNPGRQNILDLDGIKVILDYGHNAEAFHEVLGIAKSLKPSKLTGIVAAAGDRLDKHIKELGYIAAQYCDEIIIREQVDLRGRKQGESAGLIKEGIISNDFREENISMILKEEEAIINAMEKARQGEVIVLFTQCLDVIVPAINKYLENQGKKLIGEGLDFSH